MKPLVSLLFLAFAGLASAGDAPEEVVAKILLDESVAATCEVRAEMVAATWDEPVDTAPCSVCPDGTLPPCRRRNLRVDQRELSDPYCCEECEGSHPWHCYLQLPWSERDRCKPEPWGPWDPDECGRRRLKDGNGNDKKDEKKYGHCISEIQRVKTQLKYRYSEALANSVTGKCIKPGPPP